MSLGRFVAELRRRHVVRAALAYLAVAFVVLQAAEIVLPAFGLGDRALRVVVVFAALGFPVAVALAWVYELTPRGIRAMRDLDLETGERPHHTGTLFPRVALAAVVVVSASFTGWWWLRTEVAQGVGFSDAGGEGPAFVAGRSDADAPIRSLAVLPLESITRGEDEDYFAAGMHEALVSRLSKLDGLRVLSRTSVQQYDPTGKSVATIGNELGVEGLVEGSVLKAGDRVRITVQLIHAPSDRHLWANEYEGPLDDVIALQREVATAIAEEIQGELSTEEREVLAAGADPAGTSSDPEATEAMMRGRHALAERSPEAAERHFEEAIREDSAFASAWAGLAGSRLMADLEDGVVSQEEKARVKQLAVRALELDPRSAEAREVLAQVEGVGDVPGAGTAVAPGARPAPPPAPHRVAIPLPGGDTVRFVVPGEGGYAPPATDMGRLVEIARVTAAVSHRAGVESATRSAVRLAALGEIEAAAGLLEGVLEGEPGYAPAWTLLEHLVVMRGDPARAVAVREDALDHLPPAPGGPSLSELEEAVDGSGVRGYWRWRLADLEARRAAGHPVSGVIRATALAGLGRGDGALSTLLAAAREDDPWVPLVRADPTWDPWRRDPRFQAAVRTAGRD